VDEVKRELGTTGKAIGELEAKGGGTAVSAERLAWEKATLEALRDGAAPTSIQSEVQLLRIG